MLFDHKSLKLIYLSFFLSQKQTKLLRTSGFIDFIKVCGILKCVIEKP